jgi:CRISPR/Cas system-associated endonuclease Cas1
MDKQIEELIGLLAERVSYKERLLIERPSDLFDVGDLLRDIKIDRCMIEVLKSLKPQEFYKNEIEKALYEKWVRPR